MEKKDYNNMFQQIKFIWIIEYIEFSILINFDISTKIYVGLLLQVKRVILLFK